MSKRRQRRQQPGNPLPSAVVVVVVAAIVVLVGLGAVLALSPGSDSGSSSVDQGGSAAGASAGAVLPGYARADKNTEMAYLFTLERPDVMKWMPCYCGCGQHDGHLSARNCFVKESSTVSKAQFDEHGAGCNMCVTIALDTKKMLEQGKSLRDIRAFIDDKYGATGPGTNTPLPPA